MPFEFGVVSEVTIYKPVLDNFLNNESGEVGQYFRVRANRIQVAAKRQVGKSTRALEESIRTTHLRAANYQEWTIGSDNRIALLHHEGTRPHQIFARGSNDMRFSQSGRMIYTRHVFHPGTKPNRYLSDNLYLAFL